ncbi:Ser/Thr protein phosphatase family protein [Streptococcus pneumoniae]|nr:Ser/Thr protein phosphatase family protein [Streptococcus pneumoniae]
MIADAKNQGASEYWLLGDIFLPGPGANDLVALLKDLPITASVRGNWDDRVLEVLDGEYGLEYPKEIQSMRMTQYLMERMDPATIVWLRSLPLLEKKEIDGLRFSISHNLPDKNYGGDLLVENDTEKFDQLLDAETDVAVYGHVHK